MVKANSGKNITVTQSFVDKLLDKISNILKEQYALKEVDEEQAGEIELLLDKISSIERDLEELTKSLAKGSYPLKLARSIKVSPASAKPDLVPVAIAKPQLISTYNEIPSLLSGYVNPVSLTPDSYRGENSNGIILETTIKGNYWAIATQENKQCRYWLVPNKKISFDFYKLKTVESLFQLEGDYNSPESEFVLQEPAVLSLLPNNRQWKLIQPGVLIFVSNLQFSSPQSNSPNNVAKNKQYQTTVEQLLTKIKQLEIEFDISKKTHQREKQEIDRQLEEIEQFKSQLSGFANRVTSSFSKYERDLKEDKQDRIIHQKIIEQELQKNLSSTKTNSQKAKKEQETISLKSKISSFRQDYHQDNKQILDRIVAKVAISVDTLAQITFHKPDVIVLENTPHGKYWIVDYLGSYFLIPSDVRQMTKATETSLTVAKLLFDLVGFYPQYSSYHLIRPAIVSKLSSNQWKLEVKGKFNFS